MLKLKKDEVWDLQSFMSIISNESESEGRLNFM